MNLFRSEEHVRRWSLYDPGSAQSVMPLRDWARVFSGPLTRNRLDPDYLARLPEYLQDLLARLASLGRTGSYWAPQPGAGASP